MTGSPRVVQRITDVRGAVAAARSAGARIALVPTMGALHAGHLALVERAREIADFVVLSIFVNPLQFGPNEDLERYPRDLAADVEKLAGVRAGSDGGVGVDIVFAPLVAELYPAGEPETRVTAGHIGTLYEGATRPDHFDGVLTVVSKLLHIVRPDNVLFGQKDAQQVFLVERMIRDLDVPADALVVPIVREPGGLALSSRNRYLSQDERVAAQALSGALAAAAASAGLGLPAALAAAHSVLDAEPQVEPDYLVVVAPGTFLPVAEDCHGSALTLVAARVGATRLIDNRAITLG